MSKTTKKSPTQKINEAVANLLKTSKERAEIGTGLELVGNNPEVVRILKNAKLRYDADVEYLRKNIIYNCGKLAEDMSDAQFDHFAAGIRDLLPTPVPSVS